VTRLELQEDKLNILSDFAEKSLRMTDSELCSKFKDENGLYGFHSVSNHPNS
jgi:hypothetical protein